MEIQYVIYKLSLKIKRWSKRKLVIREDFFSYYKHENQKEDHIYHISELLNIDMAKEEDYKVMKLIFNGKDKLTITTKEDNKKIEEIRSLILITKQNYGIALIKSFYVNRFLSDYNMDELKNNIQSFTTNHLINNIDDMLKKNKSLVDIKGMIVYSKLQPLIQKCKKEEIDNELIEPFIPYPISIKDINQKNDYTVSPNQIQEFFIYYMSLIKLLSTIRKNQIEYRFKIVPILDKAKQNYNSIKMLMPIEVTFDSNRNTSDKKENVKSEEEINVEKDSIKEIEVIKEYNINEKENSNIIIKDQGNSLQMQLNELKIRNKELKDKYFKSLDKHAKKKEKLKRYIVTTNIKIYYCYNCGNVLSQTEAEQPTCSFDENCTNSSLFYCKKCKIAFCTYCIIYHRNTKCSNNHRLFPSKTPDLCLLCNDSDSKTYFSCQHCGVAVCAQCIGERQTKEIPCYNCNTELVWRRQVYAECNRCSQVKDCFWGCTNCDYSLCLKCVNTTKGFCGAAHHLNEFNTMNKWTSLTIEKDSKFSNNFYMKFMGKCMKCDIIIEGKSFACLRCAYFICDRCN